MSVNPSSWPAPPTLEATTPTLTAEPPLSPAGYPAPPPAADPAPVVPAPVPVPLAPVAAAPGPPPLHEPEPAVFAAAGYRVSIRMDDGEQVEVASHADEGAARAEATALMRYLRDGRGDWPFVGGRFLRPERIVSIDVAGP